MLVANTADISFGFKVILSLPEKQFSSNFYKEKTDAKGIRLNKTV